MASTRAGRQSRKRGIDRVDAEQGSARGASSRGDSKSASPAKRARRQPSVAMHMATRASSRRASASATPGPEARRAPGPKIKFTTAATAASAATEPMVTTLSTEAAEAAEAVETTAGGPSLDDAASAAAAALPPRRSGRSARAAVAKPAPARRRRRGQPVPDEELTPAQRRQNRLRAAYAELVRPLKGCLIELATRDMRRLRSIPGYHRQLPQYPGALQALREHRDARIVRACQEHRVREEALRRRVAAEVEAQRQTCANKIRDLTEDSILAVQYRFMEVALNAGLHEGGIAPGADGWTCSDVWRAPGRPEEASRSAFPIQTAAAWEQFCSQGQMRELVERFVPPLLQGPARETAESSPDPSAVAEQLKNLEGLLDGVAAHSYHSTPAPSEPDEASPAALLEGEASTGAGTDDLDVLAAAAESMGCI